MPGIRLLYGVHRQTTNRVCSIDERGTRLTGRAHGEEVDVARHQPAVEVKGATLTELDVAEDGPDAWRAQCVVDV